MEVAITSLRGGGICLTPPEVIHGAARITQIKVLGVTLISDELSITPHLDGTVVRGAASMVAQRTLPSQHWNFAPFIARMDV